MAGAGKATAAVASDAANRIDAAQARDASSVARGAATGALTPRL